jgi:sarcosine oxidase
MTSYDVIVIGLGGMGSASAYHLAVAGLRVLGLEQFGPAHAYGSSHGGTRIIREAYYEAPDYVPLVQRATQLWRELEQLTSTSLLVTTGGLMIGRSNCELISGALASAQAHNLPYEVFPAGELRRRYPMFQPDEDEVCVFEPRVGFLRPEACVQAYLQSAAQHGASLHFEEPVITWHAQPGSVTVQTARGHYQAAHLVMTAGPWTSRIVPQLAGQLQVERIPVFWFRPRNHSSMFEADKFPIFMWQRADTGFFYGFPLLEGAVKVARHYDGQTTTPDTIDRTIHGDEVEHMRSILERYARHLNGDLVTTSICMYTNSPDQHFIIDRHPEYAQVVVAAGFSGHGFKFCSVVGQMVAGLVINPQMHPLALFRWDRLNR